MTRSHRFVVPAILLLFIITAACRKSEQAEESVPAGPPQVVTAGLNQVTLPAGWKQTTDLNRRAELQAVQPNRDIYFISISDNKADHPNVTLEMHSAGTLRTLLRNLKEPGITGPTELNINGNRAIQYEVHAEIGKSSAAYLHMTVETPQQFNQLVAWTQESRFVENRPIIEQLFASFRIVPRP